MCFCLTMRIHKVSRATTLTKTKSFTTTNFFFWNVHTMGCMEIWPRTCEGLQNLPSSVFTTFKQGGFFAVIIYMASTYSSVKLSHLKDHPFLISCLLWQTRVLRIHSNLGFGRLKRQENIQHFTYSQKVNKYFRLHPISSKYQLKLQNLMTIYMYIDPIAFF